MGTTCPCELNKEFSSEFQEGYQVQKTPDKGWTTQWLKSLSITKMSMLVRLAEQIIMIIFICKGLIKIVSKSIFE